MIKVLNKNLNFFKNRKILITGGAGFIGCNLIQFFTANKIYVKATLFQKKSIINNDYVEYKKVDLTSKKDCVNVSKNIDIIFMCAANSSGAEVIDKKPLTHLSPNIVMNNYMLEAAYENNVTKFVFISSNTVYPVTDYAVSENDTNYTFFDKYHIVGWMKMFSEELCKIYSHKIKNPMDTLIIRPANIYGPYDKYTKKDSKVIAALVRRFAERENPLSVWGDGNDIKDFIFIDDFINGLIKATSMDNLYGPINISSGQRTTIKEIIETLKELSKIDNLRINFDKTKPTMIPVRLISNEYAKKKLNFVVNYSLHEGLRKTLDWYQNFYLSETPEEKNDYF